jgi:hypothetical protein
MSGSGVSSGAKRGEEPGSPGGTKSLETEKALSVVCGGDVRV